MLKELEKVHLVQDSVEGLRLTNVTAREIDIVERLGFPNLLNSAEAISRMLSVADFKSRFAWLQCVYYAGRDFGYNTNYTA